MSRKRQSAKDNLVNTIVTLVPFGHRDRTENSHGAHGTSSSLHLHNRSHGVHASFTVVKKCSFTLVRTPTRAFRWQYTPFAIWLKTLCCYMRCEREGDAQAVLRAFCVGQ